MIRKILGFAVFAVVVWVALQVTMGILGTLIGLAVTVVILAGMGYALYLILRVVSPNTAARVREMIRDRPAGTV